MHEWRSGWSRCPHCDRRHHATFTVAKCNERNTSFNLLAYVVMCKAFAVSLPSAGKVAGKTVMYTILVATSDVLTFCFDGGDLPLVNKTCVIICEGVASMVILLQTTQNFMCGKYPLKCRFADCGNTVCSNCEVTGDVERARSFSARNNSEVEDCAAMWILLGRMVHGEVVRVPDRS